VRVLVQLLVPGVQHAEEADLGSEMVGIGRDFEHCFRAGLEQEPEEDLLVLPDQRTSACGTLKTKW
jgi:hypothetical protein